MTTQELLLEAAELHLTIANGCNDRAHNDNAAHHFERAATYKAAAEKMGEPVAWVAEHTLYGLGLEFHKEPANQNSRRLTPLYAAPPPAVPDYSRVKKALEMYESEYVGQKHEPLWSWAWLAAAKEQGHE